MNHPRISGRPQRTTKRYSANSVVTKVPSSSLNLPLFLDAEAVPPWYTVSNCHPHCTRAS